VHVQNDCSVLVRQSVVAIKAAKKIRKIAVSCVDNVDVQCSERDLCTFVGKLSVSVISCFEVKPRRRRYEENELNPCQRKAFRLCIFDEDRDRLLNAAIWPDSIKISPWYFKTAAAGDDVVNIRDAAIGGSNNAAVGVDDVQPGSSIMMDITDASIATVVSVLPTDSSNVDSVAGDNTVSLSDDTILTACNSDDGV